MNHEPTATPGTPAGSTPPEAVVLYGEEAFEVREASAEVTAGRASSSDVRFGHVPVVDPNVKGTAVVFWAYRRRCFVDNRDDRYPVAVRPHEGPKQEVAPGAVLSPSADRFDVVVPGAGGEYRLRVRVHRAPLAPASRPVRDAADAVPTLRVPELAPEERSLLVAYCAPLFGRGARPADHKEVAARFGRHPNVVRGRLYRLYERFLDHPVPMDDLDPKDALAWCAYRDGLISQADLDQLDRRYPPPT